MAQGRIRKGVEKSINSAVKQGFLDVETHAATVAMLRYMADYLDSDTGETPATRYVSPASFLSYCTALGFTPGELVTTKKNGETKKTTTEKLKSKFKNYGGK